MKSLELFKKGFRKNEIVIYAIAIMLVTAGYFNYTANSDIDSVETYSNPENISVSKNIEEKEKSEEKSEENENKNNDEDIGDAKLVNSDSVKLEKESEEENDNNQIQNETDITDYFISTKLERDTNYANMISTYTKILEDNSISETQKSIAMKEITKINNTKNAISICENLLSSKGFENYVILINENSVNVVVKIEGGLEKNKVAQIQNIISRELNSKIENIHITEK